MKNTELNSPGGLRLDVPVPRCVRLRLQIGNEHLAFSFSCDRVSKEPDSTKIYQKTTRILIYVVSLVTYKYRQICDLPVRFLIKRGGEAVKGF